ncbi:MULTISPECIES: flagellar biosynthesis anti-sigma factor FlgM [Helicobacter]|uniref:Flagellar biosynthesis anti-sigma factor FlgM n=1 Tax=Helicobacter typhlonius TaxID=76936 RepID=A0A099UCR1_9HELI|nr:MULTISPECIES: flagellar biosynthesis anti-sigma factor FlgM [Helicobacter]TLD79207.1 flagellar biosynthesis anti-sigma factor FlgM [Helicobacter typhlonius]TLD86106.1 flagellar biosynthesis anti-sigma factor FlgM [Helicobacter sp. MIT 03-1616]CUU40548.1 FlgM protein [Helicobacter typhlonius]HCD73035.1 flagellar biosynthesis protein FlgM [Helicobacter sp.]
MINGVNASVVSTNALNREVLNRQNENTEVKEKEQVQQLSRAEQIKEQIKNGEYKIDLQQTSEKMASNLLNL